MRSRWRRRKRQALRVGVKFGQRAGKSIGISSKVCAGLIGLVFARTRNSELDEHRRKRRKEQHCQGAEAAATSFLTIIAVAAEDHSPAGDLREISDCAGDRSGNRADQDVAIADMAE